MRTKPDWRRWMTDRQECARWLERYHATGVLKRSEDASRLHLQKADKNLDFAGWLLEKQHELAAAFGGSTFTEWAVTVYYYASYHAALALMSREGYASKSHAAMLCFLIHHHYHRGTLGEEEITLIAAVLDKEDLQTLGAAKELRERACYDVHASFERRIAEQMRTEASAFTIKIKTLLK